MKKFLYYSDLVFLRLIPLAYFAVSIYVSLSFTPFNMGGEFGVLEVMTGSIIILFCFLFLVVRPLLLWGWHQRKIRKPK